MTETRLIHGDSLAVLWDLEPASIDSIVTDPPYGLEFMGREWDSFRLDDPGTSRHRGERAGVHGEAHAAQGNYPARGRTAVAYGAGKRPTTYRCRGCGKRDQFRNAHGCTGPEWAQEIIDPHSAPPTSLAFGEWCRRWAEAAYAAAKPGAYLLAFGGTRTHHRLTAGLEDAGWEIRDTLCWGYAQGFPKSHNVGRAVDVAAAAIAAREAGRSLELVDAIDGDGWLTDVGRSWDGWGTALKPAWEPIVLARKPLAGSVAVNVLEHGTGGLNVDATRIPWANDADRAALAALEGYRAGVGKEGTIYGNGHGIPKTDEVLDAGKVGDDLGRHPANVVLTDPIFDGQFPADVLGGGESVGSGVFPHSDSSSRQIFGGFTGDRARLHERLDAGTYSPFFLVPKAGRAEREPNAFAMHAAGLSAQGERANTHPTVKPLELMRWLVRLVTPPGGVVLDPFLGSGTTAIAAELEGFGWIGVERDVESYEIARARLTGTQRGLGLEG